MTKHITSNQWGGAAIEYLLVSAFSLLVALSAMGLLGIMFESKLSELSEKLGIELELKDINPWGGP